MASNPAMPATSSASARISAARIGSARWLVFAVLALAALLIRLPGLGDAAHDFDEQLYHLAGTRMLEDAFPYVEVWDRKPFGLFAIYAFAAALSGGSVMGYQLLAVAFAAIGACQVYVLARRFADMFAGLASAAFYLICFPLFSAPSGQSEVFYLPLLLGMLQLTIAASERTTISAAMKPLLLAMLLGGLALQIKYTVLPQCMLLGIAALWRLRQLGADPRSLAKHGATFASIGLAPTALVAAGYAIAGHFDAFAYANFQSIFARGTLTDGASTEFVRWIGYGSSWLIALAAIGGLLVLSGARRVQSGYGLVAAFLAASLIGMAMIGNIYVHYFLPGAAALVLLAAPAMSGWLAGRVLALIGLYLAIGFSHFDALAERGRADRAGMAEATALIAPHVGSRHNCLFVYDGPTALYRATGSCLPSRLAYPDHLNNALEMNSVGIDTGAEMRHIFAQRPAVVTDSKLTAAAARNPVTGAIVRDELARNYTQIGEVFFPPRMVEVHLRRDLLKTLPNKETAR